MASEPRPMFFTCAGEFRAWLEANAATAEELVVGYHTTKSGKPGMNWPDSVDEALCFGWIDGIRRSLGKDAYQIRFTPRRRGSNWSAVNIAKAEALISSGRMRPAGLLAFQDQQARPRRVYAYERPSMPELSPAQVRRFQRQPAAWKWFQQAAPSYRKTVINWVTTAKQPATQERRLERLIDACTRGVRLID